ncbi:ATPase [Rhodobacteraceae bacterium CY05]|uniref:ATPase n=1 Tax=Parasedimentitalea huanghaiensis TaxID=2682100 RepID=A0A6L6WN64_9RHOB|nr:BadF/BadG/BcrA/BcrD ATPase family protein [Zongyanglinia huanghaiensis]MVO18055.1 ATPase [Zongyanglinia huanghaiensis]
MRDSVNSYFIAIDGGGTSCRFALQSPSGVTYARRGGANVSSAPQAAIAVLNEGLIELSTLAGLEAARLGEIPIYAGLAGVVDDAVSQFVADQLPSRHVLVEDDRPSAVVGALGDRPGCLLGIGTGSFLARQTQDEMRLIGGYGSILGDESSGCWLGKELLRRALHVLDGILPTSDLVESCLSEFQHDVVQIMNFSFRAKPVDYGGYAPRVVQAARAGDTVGQELMVAGADYICSGLTALGHQPGEIVCPVGGVAEHYVDYLPAEIAATVTEGQGVALDGALELSRRFARQVGQETA